MLCRRLRDHLDLEDQGAVLNALLAQPIHDDLSALRAQAADEAGAHPIPHCSAPFHDQCKRYGGEVLIYPFLGLCQTGIIGGAGNHNLADPMPQSQHSMRYKQFCALLIAARKKAGLTQYDVATRLGKPQSFVSKYESAERRLDMIEFLDIADAIGADPRRILRGLQGGARQR